MFVNKHIIYKGQPLPLYDSKDDLRFVGFNLKILTVKIKDDIYYTITPNN